MKFRLRASIVAIAALFGAALVCVAPALACSRGPLEDKPTDFELVALADAIVIATAISEPDANNTVTFEATETLKGSAQKQRFQAESKAPLKQLPGGGFVVTSSCATEVFSKGSRYVAFLSKNANGSYALVSAPWAPKLKKLDAGPSNWLRVIGVFLQIQAKYGPLEQLDALDKLLIEKLNGPDTPENFYDAEEIYQHLAARGFRMPTAFLVRTYETLERGDKPKYGSGVIPPELKSPSSRAMMARLLKGREPAGTVSIVNDEKDEILKSLVRGDHPTAAPLFIRLSEVPNPSTSILTHSIRFLSNHNEPRRAFALMETKGIRALAAPQGNAWELADAMVQAGGHLPWRSDPYLKSVWPDFALQLYWMQVEVVRNAIPQLDKEAVEYLLARKYRERPRATLALAREENAAVLDWAVAELLAAPAPTTSYRDFPSQDPAMLPMQALVAPLRTRSEALEKVACQSADRRRLLIIAIGEEGSEVRAHTLAAMAASSSLSAEERMLLGQAAAAVYSRSGGVGNSNDENYKLLTQIIREPIVYMERKVEPLSCFR